VEKKTTEPTFRVKSEWMASRRYAPEDPDLAQESSRGEVTELLGRQQVGAPPGLDAVLGYRNGHGKPRHLTLSHGTIVARRPRVRGLEGASRAACCPLFKAPDEGSGPSCCRSCTCTAWPRGTLTWPCEVFWHEAPLSSTTIGRLKVEMAREWEAWAARPLDDPRGRVPVGRRGLRKSRAGAGEAPRCCGSGAGWRDGRKTIVAVTSGTPRVDGELVRGAARPQGARMNRCTRRCGTAGR